MNITLKRIWLFGLFAFSFVTLYARPGTAELMKMTDNDRLVVLNNIRLKLLNDKVYDTEGFSYLDSLVSLTKNNSNKELYLEALLFREDIKSWFFQFDSMSYHEVITQSQKYSLPKINIRANMLLAEYYWMKSKEYEKSFEILMKIKDLVNSIPDKDYYEKVNYWYEVGSKHYYFLDYSKAIQVLKEVIGKEEHPLNTRYYNSAINTLGLCYQELNLYDTANYYFNLLRYKEFQFGHEDWRDIAIGNLGFSFYYQKDYKESYPLLLWDFESAVKRNDPYCASGSSIALSDIYLRRNQMDKAWNQIELSRKYIREGNKFERNAFLYPIIAQWYLKNKDLDKAQAYLDSTVVAVDDYHKSRSAIQLYKVMQRIQVMEKSANLLQLEAVELKERNKKSIAISIAILTFFISVILYFFQKRRNKLKLAERDFRLQQTEIELNNSKKQLETFTKNLLEKNKLILSLEEQYKESNTEIIHELLNSVILTEDDWVKFQLLFEEAHPKIQAKLNQNFPNLSISEYRYLMLSYLNFSHKDMASVLGISADSLRVTWFRIRKKLNLEPQYTVLELLAQLDQVA